METFIKDITLGAGKIIAKYFGKVAVSYTKIDALDYVTKADLASNSYLIKAIKKQYPHHGVLSEETGYITRRVQSILGLLTLWMEQETS